MEMKTIKKKKVESKRNKMYFDNNTQKAIVKFQKYKQTKRKKEIFVKEIKPAFEKLIENIIFTYKFHTIRFY